MNRQEDRERLRWKHKPCAELVRLAWPIAVSMLSYSVMTVVDTLFVGRLGASSLAAVGLGGIASFTILCFGFALFRGGKTLVAQAVGGGRVARVPRLVGASLALAGTLGVVMVLLGQLIALAVPWLAAGEEAGRLSSGYLAVRMAGAPFALVASALREARYGLGDTRAPMRAAVAANLINIPLNALFIFGFGLGVHGAACATVLACVCEAALLACVQQKDGFGLENWTRTDVLALWRIGAPVGVERVLDVGAFTVLVALLARMSEVDLAAHQIAIQVVHFSFLPAFAIGEAVSVLVGQAVGADQDHLVGRIARHGVLLALAYMVLWSVVDVAAAPLLARLFTSEGPVIDMTVRLLYVAAVFQVFDAFYAVARGVLRGAGDVRFAAVIAVVVAWGCAPPLAAYLGIRLGYGALGGWIGLCMEIFVGGAILWTRVVRGGWIGAAQRSRLQLAATHAERRSVLAPAR